MITTSAYLIAQSFIGTEEIKGVLDNPLILAMLRLDHTWPQHDEVPWCSAFMNFVMKLCRLPRTYDLRARSWLYIGTPISLEEARPDSDIVVLKSGEGIQPGPEVIDAPGHVGLFVEKDERRVFLLGGNQGNSVHVTPFPISNILGIRRV